MRAQICGVKLMADIYDKDTKRVLRSRNTPDYTDDPRYIVLPHRRDQPKRPVKYWKADGDEVRAMTQGEKDAVDQAEQEEHDAATAAAVRERLIQERMRTIAEEQLIVEGVIEPDGS